MPSSLDSSTATMRVCMAATAAATTAAVVAATLYFGAPQSARAKATPQGGCMLKNVAAEEGAEPGVVSQAVPNEEQGEPRLQGSGEAGLHGEAGSHGVAGLHAELSALREACAREKEGRRQAEARAHELANRLQSLASKANPSPGPVHSPSNGVGGAGQATSAPLFQFRPIGYVRSCFTTRNGTPRQPLLVPSALSRLTLLPDVPDASLEGLTEWSHVWVLYWFHENTEPRSKAPVGDLHGVKGKVKVPRLNGEKVGLFATRSPHRPVPIGLSVAQVVSVEGRTVVLGGADIVDGSPVLDIKPYVPFCDALPRATAPPYVQAEAADEPLAVGRVLLTAVGREQLERCWRHNAHRTLYGSAEDFVTFVSEVLSRDIRSTRQRLHMGPAAQMRNTASLESAKALADKLSLSKAVQACTGREPGINTTQPDTQTQLSNGDQMPLEAGAPATQQQLTVSEAGNQQASAGESTVHSQPAGQGLGNSSSDSNRQAGHVWLEGGLGDTSIQAGGSEGTGVFHVVLEGVDISYDVCDGQLGADLPAGAVIVGGASLDTALALQHKHKHRH